MPSPSPAQSFLDRYAAWLVRHRWKILIAWLLLTAVLAAQIRRLNFDFTFVSLFQSRDPSVERFDEYKRIFGDDASYIAIVIRADDVFSTDTLKAITAIAESARAIPGIQRVTHLLNVKVPQTTRDGFEIRALVRSIPKSSAQAAAFRGKALTSKFIRGQLVSEDASTAAVIAEFESDIETAQRREDVQKELELTVRRVAAGRPIKVFLTGIPVVQQRLKELIFEDQIVFLPVTTIVLAVLTFLFLRRWSFVPIAFIPVLVSNIWIIGIMALAGQGVNMLNQIIPATLMVVGISDAIHLLNRYREERQNGATRGEGIQISTRALAQACFLTSFTTAVGFFSLLSARAEVIRGLGLFAGMGIMIAYVNTMVLVPLLLSLTSRETFPAATGRFTLDDRLGTLARKVCSHPTAVFGGAAIFTVIAAFAASQVESHHYILEEITTDDPVYEGVRTIEEKLSGLLTFAVVVDGGHENAVLDPAVLNALAGTQRLLESKEPHFISRTASLADLVKEINLHMHGGDPEFERIPQEKKLLYQYLLFLDRSVIEPFADEGFQRSAIRIRAKDLGSERWIKLKPALAEYLRKTLPEGYRFYFTGGSDIAVTTLSFIVRDMLVSLAWSFVIIFGIIMLLFRSVRVGLISILPNVMPLISTLGVMGAFGIPIRTASVFIFTVSLGIAVNDTIHFIARFLEERRKGSDDMAAAETVLRTSGRAMVATTVMLVAGFAVFGFSEFKGVKDFGLFGGITLFVALVLDLVLTPALFVRFGRKA